MSVRDEIERADALLESEQRDFRAELARMDAESKLATEERDAFLVHCRRATPKDYADWLRGYLRNGGRITHPRARPMDSDWYVFAPTAADSPETVPPLYGSRSIDLIVPAAPVRSLCYGRLGHNSLYFMDGFRKSGLAVVELFTDVRELLLSEGE